MRNAKEGKQKHGQQKHIERLPLFSATDTNGSMTMPLLPGRPVGRSAPLMPWRGCTVGADRLGDVHAYCSVWGRL
ncbi:hypothetical protein Q0V21_21830 [Paenibacillus sp. 11B]|nr:hypothetical protein [Paenibacillus sp. 11B]